MSRVQNASSRRQRQEKREQQNRLIVYAASALLIVGLLGLLWASLQSGNSPKTAVIPGPVQTGQPAPDFTLAMLNGRETSLSDYAGQVVVVNFWATWCPPCKAEMPAINAYYEANQDKGFVVLGVNAHEDAGTVSRFIESTGFTFPILLDDYGKVEQQYQINSFPSTFVIDRDGQIVYIHIGLISPETLAAVVDPLLS
ncbi:MAG: TlpA family protein disulfide reductase [Chloroflexi bacterium]|nr:TlpA family protein disulfide reductase [Chloroflexota bacterium]MBP7041747.1 TlpA family protein disulfide reductase [Chloroflexota bacterium]